MNITTFIPPLIEALKKTGILKDQQAIREAEVELEKALASQIQAINETMRAEAQSEHWPQWAWRPTIGFTFAAVIINNYVLLPYFQAFGLKPIDIPEGIWTAMLVVLGVAAGTRGLEKWERVKK